MAYYEFQDEEGAEYGSFEVFALDGSINDDVLNERGEPLEPGWYWWACFPGCLPDGDPIGPFETEAEALRDARGGDEGERCPRCNEEYRCPGPHTSYGEVSP